MVDSMVAVVLRLSHSGGHSKSQNDGNLTKTRMKNTTTLSHPN